MYMKISGTYSIYKNITLLRGRSFQSLSQLIISSSYLSCRSLVRSVSKLTQEVIDPNEHHIVVEAVSARREPSLAKRKSLNSSGGSRYISY